MKPLEFQNKIITWFAQHGRTTLPWQQNKKPYRVWISEVMLQQTQVITVIPYFERFIQHFPTIESLADASLDDVLHLWTGLGYYSRARNLHRSAKIIVNELEGKFPDSVESLLMLPGIGRSTAGAILAISFQQKATILDGNVKRVLTRFLGITQWPGKKLVLKKLWDTAELFTPENKIAEYTQAMMDLGATICIRGKPFCEKCPLKIECVARNLGIERKLPQPKPRKALPIREATLLIIQDKDKVFLQKKPPAGIWGGLWSLPELTGFATDSQISIFCRQHFKLKPIATTFMQSFRHTFTHFHLNILPVVVSVSQVPCKIMDHQQQIWYNLNKSPRVGLPAPVKKLLESRIHATHDSLSKVR